MVTNNSFLIMLLFMGLTMTRISWAYTEVCSADGDTSITLSVTLHRNKTGHRIVSVDMLHGTTLISGDKNRTELQVTHDSSICGSTERIELKASAVFYEMLQSKRSDYEYFPGVGSYKLHTWGRNWDDARITCLEEGAHLLVINSEEEADIVKQFFSRKPQFRNVNDPLYGAYVGLTDRVIEGEYIAVTGERLEDTGYTKWAPGEPANDRNQNFAAVESHALLHDINNGARMGFICELK